MSETLKRLHRLEQQVKSELSIIEAEIAKLRYSEQFNIAEQVIKKYNIHPFNVSFHYSMITILCKMEENNHVVIDEHPDFEANGNLLFRIDGVEITMVK